MSTHDYDEYHSAGHAAGAIAAGVAGLISLLD